MIKLTIGNSISRILGLPPAEHKALSKHLSYTPTANRSYFAGKMYNRSISLLTARGTFPTGLLYLVDQWLTANNLPHARIDSRALPSPLERFPSPSLPYPPYPDQKRASEAARAFKRGIVVAPTGTGKSVVVALIIGKIKVRTLVVVPSLELRRQLTDTLKEAYPTLKVGRLSKNGKAQPHIAVENVGALDPAVDINKLGYDAVIIDEFHHSGAKTYRKLNVKAWNGVYFKFGLTATPFRSDDNERLLLESVLSQVIYRVTYDTAVDKGYIVPVEAYFVDLPKAQDAPSEWRAVYSQLVVNNSYRNKICANLITNLLEAGKSTLCLVKEIKHGENILELLPNANVAFANGKDGEAAPHIKAFNSGEATALIGTTGVIGEGVDTKPAEYVILAYGGKSKNQFMQAVGRGVRRYGNKESCKVILFRDPSSKYLLRHFNACVKYLKEEYGIEYPVKL